MQMSFLQNSAKWTRFLSLVFDYSEEILPSNYNLEIVTVDNLVTT